MKGLQNKITLYPYLEGTQMFASFGHLMGYAAGYYSYLWALVYADDMFSIFDKNGIMDKATGLKFRDIILANGSSRDELEMVIEFLEDNQTRMLFKANWICQALSKSSGDGHPTGSGQETPNKNAT
jgi:thimet oligopeptidase